jgi:hypothetical protein
MRRGQGGGCVVIIVYGGDEARAKCCHCRMWRDRQCGRGRDEGEAVSSSSYMEGQGAIIVANGGMDNVGEGEMRGRPRRHHRIWKGRGESEALSSSRVEERTMWVRARQG